MTYKNKKIKIGSLSLLSIAIFALIFSPNSIQAEEEFSDAHRQLMYYITNLENIVNDLDSRITVVEDRLTIVEGSIGKVNQIINHLKVEIISLQDIVINQDLRLTSLETQKVKNYNTEHAILLDLQINAEIDYIRDWNRQYDFVSEVLIDPMIFEARNDKITVETLLDEMIFAVLDTAEHYEEQKAIWAEKQFDGWEQKQIYYQDLIDIELSKAVTISQYRDLLPDYMR